MMHLFYLDESGNTGTALSVDQPIHWLVGVGATPDAVKRIEDELLAIALRHFPIKARRPDFEFHGQALYSGRDEYKSMDPQKRVDLYGEILQLIGRHDCKIFIRGIEKSKHQARATVRGYVADHPHRLACMYIIEEIDRWLEKLSGSSGVQQYGLLVADEQKEHERNIVASFAAWRNAGTIGYKARSIQFLIDTVHYVQSNDSWMIQLADCAAFIGNRAHRVWRTSGYDSATFSESDKAVVELWATHCRPHVKSSVIWPE